MGHWLAQCKYTVTGGDNKLNLQLLSQCDSTCCHTRRSVPEIHIVLVYKPHWGLMKEKVMACSSEFMVHFASRN